MVDLVLRFIDLGVGCWEVCWIISGVIDVEEGEVGEVEISSLIPCVINAEVEDLSWMSCVFASDIKGVDCWILWSECVAVFFNWIGFCWDFLWIAWAVDEVVILVDNEVFKEFD